MYMDAPRCLGSASTNQRDGANPSEAATLKAVVRGERAVEDIKATRIWISARQAEGSAPPGRVSHMVCSADLAEGIVNLKDDPVALEELANAIVAISGLLSFDDEHSDRLISCVWSLAMGEPLREPTIRLANAVRNRSCAA